MTTDYQKGYSQCLNDIDQHATMLIKRNNNGQSLQDILHVFNGMIGFLYMQQANMPQPVVTTEQIEVVEN